MFLFRGFTAILAIFLLFVGCLKFFVGYPENSQGIFNLLAIASHEDSFLYLIFGILLMIVPVKFTIQDLKEKDEQEEKEV